MLVPAPTDDCLVSAQSARVRKTSRDGGVDTIGRVCSPNRIPTPADDCLVSAQSAPMSTARTYRDELASRRRKIKRMVVPAGESRVRAQRTPLPVARGDIGEPTARHFQLASFVFSPTDDALIGFERTSVAGARSDRHELAVWCLCLTEVVRAPTLDGPVRP